MLGNFWDALQASGVGVFVRESAWAYPFANVVHVLGAIMVAGGAILLDLRILGLANSLHAASVWRALTPIAVFGFVLMLLSGGLLFTADAASLAVSRVFQVKLMMIVFAVANAGLFRLYKPRLDIPPTGARISAALSIFLWLGVVTAGRLIAYL